MKFDDLYKRIIKEEFSVDAQPINTIEKPETQANTQQIVDDPIKQKICLQILDNLFSKKSIIFQNNIPEHPEKDILDCFKDWDTASEYQAEIDEYLNNGGGMMLVGPFHWIDQLYNDILSYDLQKGFVIIHNNVFEDDYDLNSDEDDDEGYQQIHAEIKRIPIIINGKQLKVIFAS